MKLETFFEKFEVLAEMPGAVGKLREMILRSAMLGRLSEPNRTDGSVDQLLQEVEQDKARIGLERSVKPGTANSEFLDEEIADEIPVRWTWVRFGNIARHNAGKTLDMGRNRGQLRDYITTSNLYWGFFQLDAVRQMPIADEELERCTAVKGDLLICEGGEGGRAAVWPHRREIAFQNHIHRARLFAGINPFFVQRYFEKLNATGEIEKYRKGVGISNMSGKALASIPIPLPTVAEQSRIVAKVDELMALCDRLEAQQKVRETRHTALARASLAQFADAPTPANLPFLFHPSYTIPPADLRKFILTLAVQGKLVTQDPNDEPPETLCERDDELAAKSSFEIPPGWIWTRLTLLADINGGFAFKSTAYTEAGTRVVRISDFDEFGFKDHKVVRHAFDPDLGKFTLAESNILMAMTGGTVGKSLLVTSLPEPMLVNQRVATIKVGNFALPRYIDIVLRSELIQEVIRKAKNSTNDNISMSDIKGFTIPLPPLAEQCRIVAKVEQLVALVDAMEQRLAGSRVVAANILALTGEFASRF